MNPYYVVHSIASNAPSPTDTEVVSLQKINALLLIIAAQGSGSSGLQIYDPVNAVYYTLTAPNKILTLT